jgi:hypothetical protein
VIESFGAIARHDNSRFEFILSKSPEGQLRVVWIILHQEDIDPLPIGHD